MGKRAFAWITLASFLVFSWSCYSWQKQPLQSLNPEKRVGTEVSAVQTKSGNKIDFTRNPAARILADYVVGEKYVHNIQVEKAKIEEPKDLNVPTPFTLTTTDGSRYRVTFLTALKNMEDKIILSGSVFLSMPLSDIDLVWIKKLNATATFMLIIIPIALAVGLMAMAMHSLDEDLSSALIQAFGQ